MESAKTAKASLYSAKGTGHFKRDASRVRCLRCWEVQQLLGVAACVAGTTTPPQRRCLRCRNYNTSTASLFALQKQQHLHGVAVCVAETATPPRRRCLRCRNCNTSTASLLALREGVYLSVDAQQFDTVVC